MSDYQDDMPWVDLTPKEIEELRSKKFALTEYGKEKLKQMEAEREATEHKFRSERVLERYNRFYNAECSGLTHGTPITSEFQQAMTLECMLDALRCENLNHEFDAVSTKDINALIDGLYQQGKNYLERGKYD